MTDRKTVNKQLDALGHVPIEPVEPRLGDLEARLLAAIGDEGEHRLAPILGQPTRRGARLLLVAAAVGLLAVAGALLAPKASDDTIVIAAANEVSIILPDGTAVIGSAGLELPDGATIEVDGYVEVDGRRFGPGRYKVDDGVLIVLPISSDSSTTMQPAAPAQPAPSVSPTSPPSTRVSTTVPGVDDDVTETESEVVRTAPPVTRPPPTRPTTPTSLPIGEEPVRTIPATTVGERPTTTAVPTRTTITTSASTSVPPTTAVRRGLIPERTVPVRRGSA